MRVISGSARGRKLLQPVGRDIRPTLDRVRTAIFNMLVLHLEGADFLDLFSGTGANGIEALSRGAASAVFVDNDAEAQRIIRENLFHTGLARQARCLALTLPQDLPKLSGSYDIIFADPPYGSTFLAELLETIGNRELLRPDGILMVEHGRRDELPELVGGLQRTRQKRYGDTVISVYEWPSGEEARGEIRTVSPGDSQPVPDAGGADCG